MSADLGQNGAGYAAEAAAPGRPSAAKLTFPRSLRSRLPILIALVVAAVLTTATYAEIWSVGRAVERSLVETAERTARTVVEDLAARRSGFDPADVHDSLHELIGANSVLHSISIVDVGPAETQVVASTSSEEREESLALGRQAVASGGPQIDRMQELTAVAMPLVKDGHQLAVVAAVSRASVRQIAAQGQMVFLWFALPSIAIVTILIDVVMRRLIHNPIDELRGAIRRVSDGDLSSRATVLRDDELGTVATGLNDMLSRTRHRSWSCATASSRRAINACLRCAKRSRGRNEWPPSARWPRASRTRWARRSTSSPATCR
jgi:HAMP domain-containing protein